MDADAFLAGVREQMGAKQVFGEPVERDGATVIPAATVRAARAGVAVLAAWRLLR